MQGKIDKQKQDGEAFLKANKDKPGVVTLPEGMQYEVIKEGNGPKPAITDKIKAHYKGALLDGKEFDSSFKRNAPFSAPLRSLINQGSHWRFWIPSDLAYGDRGAGRDIPGGATLVFEVELLEILK